MRQYILAAAILAIVLMPASVQATQSSALRLNQIQVVGTHNSYSQPADPRVFDVMSPIINPIMEQVFASLPAAMLETLRDEHPNDIIQDLEAGLEYRFPSLDSQLSSGLRSIELDLNVDHAGGRFLNPLSYQMLRNQGVEDLEPLYTDALREPGLKVLHMADVDFRSSCPTFRLCLRQIRDWSDSNPGHTPVFILLEPKFQSMISAIAGSTRLDPFDARAFAEIDATITEIFGRDRVVTPDDLRGGYATLEAAALAGNWPTIEQARGKVVFLLIVPGLNLATFAPYLEGRPNLEGRMAFLQGRPGMPHAAFAMIDNAMTRGGEITDLVRRGYIVRTRADIDTGEARANDTTRREAALDSGAQIVSTDYPYAPNIFGNSYAVPPFETGGRLNPINGPERD